MICVTSLSFKARHHTKEPAVTASLPACATHDEIIVRIAQSGTAAHDLHLDCKTALGLCPGSQIALSAEGILSISDAVFSRPKPSPFAVLVWPLTRVRPNQGVDIGL